MFIKTSRSSILVVFPVSGCAPGPLVANAGRTNDNVLATHSGRVSDPVRVGYGLARMDVPFGVTENALELCTAHASREPDRLVLGIISYNNCWCY